jgi:hypothetical protein
MIEFKLDNLKEAISVKIIQIIQTSIKRLKANNMFNLLTFLDLMKV